MYFYDKIFSRIKGYLYILRCSDERLYIGSTIDLKKRVQEHQAGEGSNFSKKRLPVELIYFEEFERIDQAFHRKKQVQRWSRGKKEALAEGNLEKLRELAKCLNMTHYLIKK
ncbi:MAG: GIY-YIG nuclease family protein [Lentimicrobium sp.]|nr:GIY-YIG nuclease family protein [Lentimicrobium sp.]